MTCMILMCDTVYNSIIVRHFSTLPCDNGGFQEKTMIQKIVAIQALVTDGYSFGYVLKIAYGLCYSFEVAVLCFKSHAPETAWWPISACM